jgi:hypothetical protein
MEVFVFLAIVSTLLVLMASSKEMGYIIRIPHAPWQRELREPPIPTLTEYSRERRKLEEEALLAFEKELSPPPPPKSDIEYYINALPPPTRPKYKTSPSNYVDLVLGDGYQMNPPKPSFHSGGLANYTPPVGDMMLAAPTDPKAALLNRWGEEMMKSNREIRDENRRLSMELRESILKMKRLEEANRYSSLGSYTTRHFSPSPSRIPPSIAKLSYHDYMKGVWDGKLD